MQLIKLSFRSASWQPRSVFPLPQSPHRGGSMKPFSTLLLAVFVTALAQAQTPAADMKMLVGRSAIVQRMPFYQPGTYQTIPNTYAGQTVTIIDVKPSAMFAAMPKLTERQMASL